MISLPHPFRSLLECYLDEVFLTILFKTVTRPLLSQHSIIPLVALLPPPTDQHLTYILFRIKLLEVEICFVHTCVPSA